MIQHEPYMNPNRPYKYNINMTSCRSCQNHNVMRTKEKGVWIYTCLSCGAMY